MIDVFIKQAEKTNRPSIHKLKGVEEWEGNQNNNIDIIDTHEYVC